MFLDCTYFTGRLALPNMKRSGEPVGLGAALQTVQENSLEWFIAIYEKEALDKILGETLADNFIKGKKEDPENVIWSDLYGKIYREAEGFKLSPTANYVYYWIQRDSISKTAMIGEVKPTADHAINVSPAAKMVDAWNAMCPEVVKIRRFVFDNWEVYEPYVGKRACLCNDICRPINEFNL